LKGLLPMFEVHGPNDETFAVELTKDRLTIGRFQDFNDIGLEPDPQQLITRKAHCVVEREADTWWVIDNGSVNRTFIRREGGVEVVYGRASIQDGDAIRILGLLTDNGQPLYWELVFRDPLKTQRVDEGSSTVTIEYDWIQARLFRIEGTHREEIRNLRPQEHKLIRYMDQRNRANGQVAVMCSYEELITAIWGDEINHVEAEVNHLVYELRQKIEPDPNDPRFLQSVRGLGYRLETHPAHPAR
jgi:pSer/pThr/pTyr-binding forkhead associated (FHA) protein